MMEKRGRPLPPPTITRGRRGGASRCCESATETAPLPAGYGVPHWGDLVRRATEERLDVVVGGDDDDVLLRGGAPPTSSSSRPATMPRWMPSADGERLCNLTGRQWRILQRAAAGSHRWTTDDLVTACAAVRELRPREGEGTEPRDAVRYLDLGTGNGSVLLMVLSRCLGLIGRAVGVEARGEAVDLARRSVEFNVGGGAVNGGGGDDEAAVRIVRADFRTWAAAGGDEKGKFDLVTGTPPYFRVEFTTVTANSDDDDDDAATATAAAAVVSEAVIRQGGMPLERQSAPARCEFRGGIEAYCGAAAAVLSGTGGTFVVCVNHQNRGRALAAFRDHSFCPRRIYEIEGKKGRGTLFCVYVLVRRTDESARQDPEVISMAVRDDRGEWTDEYRSTVLDTMSIPHE
jgi:tRNA1(Val) A37 N6-methylase TrmN6